MILEALRAATAEKHQELDYAMTPVIKKATDTESYTKVLEMFYGSFKPVYTAIREWIGAEEVPDIDSRFSLQNLEKDLVHYGIDPSSIQLMENPPVINTKGAAMGALYVLEGSSLGGVYLAKMLKDQLGIDETDGLAFFAGYGKETKAKWTSFIQSLENFAADCNCDLQITEAAADTFDSIKLYLTGTDANS